MPKAISKLKLHSILSGLNSSHSVTWIVSDCHVAHGTVTAVQAEHRPNLIPPLGGRPRKLSPMAIHHAVCIVTHGNSVSAIQATQLLSNLTGVTMHPQTICCALK